MPPRLKRYQHEGHLHFITFSCYRRLPFLDNDFSRICFEELLDAYRRIHHFDVNGYVLMPEHVHLLVSEPAVGTLNSTLRVLRGEASKRLKGERDEFWRGGITTSMSSQKASASRTSNTCTAIQSPARPTKPHAAGQIKI